LMLTHKNPLLVVLAGLNNNDYALSLSWYEKSYEKTPQKQLPIRE